MAQALILLDRELRVRSRKWSTYLTRCSAAAVGVVLGGMMLFWAEVFSSPGKIGSGMFPVMGWLAFWAAWFDGARQTADTLSFEKRAGTLGLLFLTDLKPFDVVLGKWLGASINSIYVVVAMLPLIGLPLLLGGVTAGEFVRLCLVLLDTLFLSLCVGIAVSAKWREERTVWWAALGILAVLTFVPALIGFVPVRVSVLFSMLSPLTAMRAADAADYLKDPSRFWGSLACVHLVGWLFLAWASRVLPHSWQDAVPEPAKAQPLPPPFPASTEVPDQQTPAVRSLSSRKPIEGNPVRWLATRRETSFAFPWVLVAVLIGLQLVVLLVAGPRSGMSVGYACPFFFYFAMIVGVAYRASYLPAEGRESGMLIAMMAAPLKDADFLAGYIEALKARFMPPTLAFCIACPILIGICGAMSEPSILSVLPMVGVSIAQLGAIVLDIYAAGLFGLYMGLTMPKPAQAFGRAMLLGVLLPLFCLPCGPLLLLFPVKSWLLISWSHTRLKSNFRKMVLGESASLRTGLLRKRL